MNSKIMFLGNVDLRGKEFPCHRAHFNVCVLAENQWEASKRVEEFIKNHSYYSKGKITMIEVYRVNRPEQISTGADVFQFIP